MNPRRNLRLRLTLYYSGIFLVSSTVLVGLTYLTVRHNLGPVRGLSGDSDGALLPQRRLDHDAWRRTIAQLSLVFGFLTSLSILVGALLATRALRPLRQIGDAARAISETSSAERINLRGPSDELKELADGLDRMFDRIDSVVSTQRRFIADASHELRTPLAVMRAGIDVTLTDPAASEEERRAAVDTLSESIERSESLIKSLLALARSEAAAERREETDLAEIAAQSLSEITEQIEERDLSLTTDLLETKVNGDPALLRTMVANLFRNAVIYNRARGSIAISVSSTEHSAYLRVSNTGDVVLQDEVLSLFEPFRRARASRLSGVGLGLAIVKSVVDAHRGEVSASAHPDGGLEVTVRLPLAGSAQLYPGTPGGRQGARQKRWLLGLMLVAVGGIAAAIAFGFFTASVAVAHDSVVNRSNAQFRRGATAFPLVWAGMSEENVRRIAGPATWSGPSRVCPARVGNVVTATPCWPGERCLEYGDSDSSSSVEFCFQGGLVSKRVWSGAAWRARIDR